MLIEKIDNDLKAALKQKESLRVSVLRMLKTAITNKTMEKNTDKLDDGEVLSLIRKDVARHRDSIEQFQKGGREDLAKKEAAELEVLKSYLPKEPSPEEIREAVKAVITELSAAGKKDFGRVMKASLEKLKNSCDGKSLSTVINELLGP